MGTFKLALIRSNTLTLFDKSFVIFVHLSSDGKLKLFTSSIPKTQQTFEELFKEKEVALPVTIVLEMPYLQRKLFKYG